MRVTLQQHRQWLHGVMVAALMVSQGACAKPDTGTDTATDTATITTTSADYSSSGLAERHIFYNLATNIPEGDVLYRINAGSQQVVKVAGSTWQADTLATAGKGISVDCTVLACKLPAYLASQQQDKLDNDFLQYHFKLKSGHYRVKLFFAELDPRIKAGDRFFHFNVEQKRLRFIDVAALAGGAMRPVILDMVVPVTDGSLDILFGAVEREAMINAIEVSQVPKGVTHLNWSRPADRADQVRLMPSEISGYQVQVDAEEPLPTRWPSFSLQLPAGKHQIRVRAIDQNGVAGEWSELRAVDVKR